MVVRLTGLVRDIAFAAVFGAGMSTDAWFAAWRVPNLLRELLAEGTLQNVTLPLFARENERGGPEAGWALANALLGVLLVVLGLATLAFFAVPEPLVLLVASGFAATPGKVELAADLVRLLSPFLAGLSVATLFGGLLNARGRFFLPALVPAVLNLAVLAACFGAGSWERATGTPAIGAVAAASTVAGIAMAALQWPALRREGFRFRPTLLRHPALGEVGKYFGVALVGVGVVQFNLLVEMQIASRLGEGAPTWLELGFRLVQIPQSVFAGSVAVAGLAGLSALVARGDRAGAREALGRSMELTLLFVLPAAVGMYVLAGPLIDLLYRRGAFTTEDAVATAAVLRGYAIATPGICLYRVLLPAFFALGEPRVPMRLSLGVMVAKVPLACALVWPLGLGLSGLPLSHAITATCEVAALLWVARRRLDGLGNRTWGQIARIAAASAGMGAALVPLVRWADGVATVGVVAVGAAVFGGLSWALGVDAVRRVAVRVGLAKGSAS